MGAPTAESRECWATRWAGVRWDWWVRLEWRRAVSEETALVHVHDLRVRLLRESSGTMFVAGVHREPMRHAHGVWKMSRRQRLHILNAAEAQAVLQCRWPHGEVWVQAFDGERYEPHGTIAYIGRHPETVTW